VVVRVDAEMEYVLGIDVKRAEHVIVSQWKDVSASEDPEARERVDEILRPLGSETRLVV